MATAKCQGITSLIEKLAPKKLAENWDNVGLLVGDGGQAVKKIMVCLDAPEWVIDEAILKKVDLIITHHPMIFGGMKRVNTDSVLGRKVIKLIKNQISLYSAHTNYDIACDGLNDLVAKTLGFDSFEVIEPLENHQGLGLGRLITLENPMVAEELVQRVKEQLKLSSVGFAGKIDKKIKKLAILNGSGNKFASAAKFAGADLFITGDINYHEILDSVEMGMCIIDAGHYGTEKIMMKNIYEYLTVKCQEMGYDVEIIISETNIDPIEQL